MNQEETCYYRTEECTDDLWSCQTCGETFCSHHFHVTSKGTNVECVACEQARLEGETQNSEERAASSSSAHRLRLTLTRIGQGTTVDAKFEDERLCFSHSTFKGMYTTGDGVGCQVNDENAREDIEELCAELNAALDKFLQKQAHSVKP